MPNVSVKRGYVKWTDEDGTRHKVPLTEYNAILELRGEEPIEGESAPARGYAEDEPEVPQEAPEGKTVVEEDYEVAERALPRDQ